MWMRCVVSLGSILVLGFAGASADHQPLECMAFSVGHELTLPGTPVEIYDKLTGDLSPWWDHTFSPSPRRFFIDPQPGGGFYEIFDETGDGVEHATVIWAERGVRLRFEGPLGFSGRAVTMVHTYDLAAVGKDSTRLSLAVRASGEAIDGAAEAVDAVWRHFLFDRFKPYVEAGRVRD